MVRSSRIFVYALVIGVGVYLESALASDQKPAQGNPVSTGEVTTNTIQALTTTGGSTPQPDDAAIETLDKIQSFSFTATPSVLRPFEPQPGVLNWEVRLPNDPDAARITFTIDDINVEARGSRSVLPTQTTSYQLIAHLRREQRVLATATVNLDLATTCADTVSLFSEDAIRRLIEERIDQIIPVDNREGLTKGVSVGVEPAKSSLHVHAQIHVPDVKTVPIWVLALPPYPDAGIGIDADITVDMRIGLSTPRGLLDVEVPLTELDADIDLEGPDELYKLSPAVHIALDEARQRILIILSSGVVQNLVNSKLDQLFHLRFGDTEYRYFSITMRNRYPDNSQQDYAEFIACKYPRPWTARLTWMSLSLNDNLVLSRTADVNGNRSANVSFFFDGQSTGKPRTSWRVPQTGTSVLPLNASGQGGEVSLATLKSQDFALGMLDELKILVTGHDIDRDGDWCAPGSGQPPSKPTCPTPPARHVARAYDLGQRFGSGTHSERSNEVGGESFQVTYRVALVCPQCASARPTNPLQ
jgi:hypothetical protein